MKFKPLLFLLFATLFALTAAPDVGARTPEPVKRTLTEIKAHPQTVQPIEVKVQPPTVELAEQKRKHNYLRA